MFRRVRGRSYDFSEGCRQTLLRARAEAEGLTSGYVSTEHILLAIVTAPEDGVAQLLARLRLVSRDVRRDVEKRVRASQPERVREEGGALPYTSRAKKVLELAMSEARELGHSTVDAGHLFLALIAEEKGIAAQVLRGNGVSYASARAGVAEVAISRDKRFAVYIDDQANLSIYEQIVAQVQEAVATGGLLAGERLATVRELADELDIAPGTVARAYSELERLGVVMTDGVRGTRVANRSKQTLADDVRPETLVGLLRPVAVAAFHLGASAVELRQALDQAMQDIFEPRGA